MASETQPPMRDESAAARRRHLMPRWQVFIPSATVIVAFVAYAWVFTDQATAGVERVQEVVVTSLGWFYIVIVAGFVVFVLVMGLGRFGDVKLGRDRDEPEFSIKAWLAMLFAAGMGIGLVFWGVAEPLSHLANPRPGVTGTDAELAQQAMIQTLLHWGVHPWAIYVIVGLAIAYAVHRRGRPVSIRWALEPVLGRSVRGWVGDLIDIVAIVGTVFGVATSLGLGVLQIAEGMALVGDIDPGTFLHVSLVVGITLIAILSVATGLRRGIKWLSQINISLMALLLVFVLVAGPTLFLLREFVQSVGVYLQNLLRLSFDVGALQGDEGAEWAAAWTTFYWGWWMSWAPFVGIFIARISKGRTVRQFVGGVLLVPTLVSFLWFSVLGGAALHEEVFGPGGLIEFENDAAVVTEEGALFGLLGTLPAATFVSLGVIVLIALFFITSSDSGSLVVDMLSSGGSPDPPTWSRVFWAAVEGAVAVALVLMVADQEGLAALQTAVVIAAVPVSVVMILMCVALWRQLHAERTAQLRAERDRRAEELATQVAGQVSEEVTEQVPERVTEHLIDEGIIRPRRRRRPRPEPPTAGQ
jgi:choline/glycine/proline betaine transport protein